MRILIVKTSSLGDIVHTFPVIDWIRENIPHATIDWVVEKGGGALLVEAHPHIAKVFVVDTLLWRKALLKRGTWKQIHQLLHSLRAVTYDVLFDMQGNTKSTFFTAFARARKKVGFGRRTVSEWPNLFFTNWKKNHAAGVNVREEYLTLCQGFFKEVLPFSSACSSFKQGQVPLLKISREEQLRKEEIMAPFSGSQCLMVCPGSRWENKRVADTTWITFLQETAKAYNLQVLLIYSGEEEKLRVEEIASIVGTRVHTIGGLTLSLWHALMQEMDGVISVDSVGLHLAASSGVPTLSLFGPSSSAIFGPQGKEHTSIQGSCPYNENFSRRCPRLRSCLTGACLKDLSAATLFKNFQEWWSGIQSRRALLPD